MGNREAAAHLLRRTTFGPTAAQVDAAERAGVDATLAALLAPTGPDLGAAATPIPALGPDPYAALSGKSTREQRQQAQQQRRQQVQTITQWWISRLVAADHQLSEKLVFFWHGHWATSVQKVKSAALMLRQQETFRRYGRGDFGVLVTAMVHDPALIFWLDGQRSTRQAPNENLARELMELFTLGIGNYTEDDVKAGARALTGWVVERTSGEARFNQRRHDSEPKTIFGRTAAFDADSYADLLVRQPASATFLARRLWFRFGSGEPMTAATEQRLTSAYGAGRDVTALLRALFRDPAFAGTAGGLVKQPVEWAVGAMRQLGITVTALDGQSRKQLTNVANGLDQVLFRPPSVGGWPAGTAWLTTSSTQARLRAAAVLAGLASTTVLDRLAAAPAAGRVDALARLLVVDRWTDRSRAVLTPAVGNIRQLLTFGLVSPEYAVH
ncbi:DUF1800 domain-containing protein [Micromonospora sp. NPDC049679]|uniref:DUF1800 domain-containing protein n=1 Tax=Micromonospora sp. NPDC049679 TaxID=3155920 RepID=UPI0033C6A867